MPKTLFEKMVAEMEILDRHILMLKATKKYQPVGIIRLSEIMDLPKHKIRYSLRLLEREGLIKPSPEGARVTDKYETYLAETSRKLDRITELVETIKKDLK